MIRYILAMKFPRYILIAFAFCCMACAHQESCPVETNIAIQFAKKTRHYDYYTQNEIKAKYPFIHGDGITKSIKYDSSRAGYYYSNYGLAFPLDVSKDTSRFIFEGVNGNDTLVLQYKRVIEKCSQRKKSDERFVLAIRNLHVNKHTFDSVSVTHYNNEIIIFP